jgi:hypothetical protein
MLSGAHELHAIGQQLGFTTGPPPSDKQSYEPYREHDYIRDNHQRMDFVARQGNDDDKRERKQDSERDCGSFLACHLPSPFVSNGSA